MFWFDLLNNCEALLSAFPVGVKHCTSSFFGRDLPAYRPADNTVKLSKRHVCHWCVLGNWCLCPACVPLIANWMPFFFSPKKLEFEACAICTYIIVMFRLGTILFNKIVLAKTYHCLEFRLEYKNEVNYVICILSVGTKVVWPKILLNEYWIKTRMSF